MAWGSAQEPASLYSLLAAFPDSQLGEVGLCWLDPQDLPPDWGFSRYNLPFLGASPDGLLRHPLSPPDASPADLDSSAQDATVSNHAARFPQHEPLEAMTSVQANSNATGRAPPTGHMPAQNLAGQPGGASSHSHAPFSGSAADDGTASSMPCIPTVQDIEKQLRQQQPQLQHVPNSIEHPSSDASRKLATQPTHAVSPTARALSMPGSGTFPLPAMATSAAQIIVGTGPAQPKQAASNGQQAIMDLLQLLQTGSAPNAATTVPVSVQGSVRQSSPSAAPSQSKTSQLQASAAGQVPVAAGSHSSPSQGKASAAGRMSVAAANPAQGTAAPHPSGQASATKQPQPISRSGHRLGCHFMHI